MGQGGVTWITGLPWPLARRCGGVEAAESLVAGHRRPGAWEKFAQTVVTMGYYPPTRFFRVLGRGESDQANSEPYLVEQKKIGGGGGG